MANPEHVQIVRQGAAAIEEFLEKYPDVRFDLTGASLMGAGSRGANLRDANLTGANLYGADLSHANLIGANLRDANLTGANLIGANLRDAKLSGADLSFASLSLADLSGADLSFAHLSGADLSFANLSLADLSGADLFRADLNGANLNAATLNGADLSGTRVRSTVVFEGVTCYQTRVDRSTAEYMRDHLTHGQMMDLIIADDLATLRGEFSGLWGAIHLISILVFLLPYAWFLVQQSLASRVRDNTESAIYSIEAWAKSQSDHITIVSSESFKTAVESKIQQTAKEWREQLKLEQPQEMSILAALFRYIWNGGNRWREGYYFNGSSFVPFVCVALYNALRLTLMIKTIKLETLESVRKLPVVFSMGTGWKSWRAVYKLNQIGYWVALGLILKSTVYFLSTSIQL